MELVEYCRKNNVLPDLDHFLQDLLDYYEKNQTFVGLERLIKRVNTGEEEDCLFIISFVVNDVSNQKINLDVIKSMEDKPPLFFHFDLSYVNTNLTIDRLKLTKSLVEFLTKQRKGR